jgi:excisionase family DNA binding protein
MEKEFYTVLEAAELLGVTKQTIEAAIRRGELVGSKRFNRWFILHSDLLEYIAAGRVTAADVKTIFNPRYGIERKKDNPTPPDNK